MLSKILLSSLAAGSLWIDLTAAAPLPAAFRGLATKARAARALQPRSGDTTYITTFGGDGTTATGWPDVSDWVKDFDTMFANNKAIMLNACTQFGVAANTEAELDSLSSAIQSVASSASMDPRFVLAIVLQESNGCVRVPTSSYSVANPGLMQSHEGAGSCNSGTSVQNPCPLSEITQMVTDGTKGTATGDGLVQCMTKTAASDVSKYYKTARLYNSGSATPLTNLGGGDATHCYSSDIANRLIGWNAGPTGCNANTVGTLTKSDYKSSGGSSSGTTSTTTTTTGTTSGSGTAPVASAATSAAVVAPVAPAATSAVVVAPAATATPAASPPKSVGINGQSKSVVDPTTTTNTNTNAGTSGGSGSSSSSAQTPGSPCTDGTQWLCITGGTTFQQCASRLWSAVQSMPAGEYCTPGMSSSIQISTTAS